MSVYEAVYSLFMIPIVFYFFTGLTVWAHQFPLLLETAFVLPLLCNKY